VDTRIYWGNLTLEASEIRACDRRVRRAPTLRYRRTMTKSPHKLVLRKETLRALNTVESRASRRRRRLRRDGTRRGKDS